MKHILTFILLMPLLALAQTAYEIPFASGNNSIELTVQNTSILSQQAVQVKVKNAPTWLRFAKTELTLTRLEGNQEKTAVFSFLVEKTAPVNREQTLSFIVEGSSGQNWNKNITLKVIPPEHFELFQNYPNPFNPATTIGYQLPANSRVILRVYNLIGQEVATLVDADRPAGYHQESWDASRHSSGMYVYEIIALSAQKKTVNRKTMLLVR